MQSKTLRYWAIVASVVTGAGAGGCGGDNMSGSSTGAPSGGGVSGAPQTSVNGCTTFTDETAAGSSRTVTFTFPSYSPPCMLIAAGQSVTFSGSFASHPLQPGVAPDSSGTASPGNPIPATSSGTSLTVAFPDAGTYPFYCALHFAMGMAGAIQVK